MNGVRVLTFNVLAPRYGGWAERGPLIASALRELAADVVALQEVVDAKELVGPEYHLVEHPWRGETGEGATLASRWPVGDVHEVDLRLTDHARSFAWTGAVIAEILAPAPLGPFLFVHHKPIWALHGEHDRELQAVRTAQEVEALIDARHRHVLLAGDFDATPDAASVRFWTGRQSLHGTSVSYHDTWESVHPYQPGFTYTSSNPLLVGRRTPQVRDRRIDYVMVRGDGEGPTLETRSSELACHLPVDCVQPSDHYGVVADLVAP